MSISKWGCLLITTFMAHFFVGLGLTSSGSPRPKDWNQSEGRLDWHFYSSSLFYYFLGGTNIKHSGSLFNGANKILPARLVRYLKYLPVFQILQGHSDEVWFLQFSHNGKYLASSSKDQSTIIWEVKEDGHVSLKHVLTGHRKPVLVASWSLDDCQLLTCGLEENVRRWDVNSGKCLHVYEKHGIGLISCGWFADGRGIFSGMTDKSICLWDLTGRELQCWKGQQTLKISDMAITDDGKKIISICKETAILLLDREANFERLIEEEDLITSFSLSKDNKFLLVNLMNQEIHLWDIEGDIKVVAKYKGHKRARFVIRSCFGGFEQAFVASGSEDSQVYIWHRDSGELIMALPGHSGAVNCVSWSPTNLHMLASASDDRTIRIWGLKDQLN
ncbi:hypothetical protein UlMin_010695 [Ulmus minor]